MAIQVGVLLAAFLFMQRISNETQVTAMSGSLDDDDELRARDMSQIEIPAGVEVFEIYGSLFFGAVSQFKESIRVIAKRPTVLILRMRHMTTIDASGIHILEDLAEEAKDRGYAIVFSAVSRSVYRVMRKTGFVETVGRENFAADIFAALEIAKKRLAANEMQKDTES